MSIKLSPKNQWPLMANPNYNFWFPPANPYVKPTAQAKPKPPTQGVNNKTKHDHLCPHCEQTRICHLDTCGWEPGFNQLHEPQFRTEKFYHKTFTTWYTLTGYFRRCYKCKRQGCEAKQIMTVGLSPGESLFRTYAPNKRVIEQLASFVYSGGDSTTQQIANPKHSHITHWPEMTGRCNDCQLTHIFCLILSRVCKDLVEAVPLGHSSVGSVMFDTLKDILS